MPNCSALRLAAFVAFGSSSVSPGGLPACTAPAGCPRGVLSLARHLTGLIGGLACRVLGLLDCLSCGVLHAWPAT